MVKTEKRSFSLFEVAEACGCKLQGDGGVVFEGISTLREAKGTDITFFSNKKYLKDLKETKGGAIILSGEFAEQASARENIALLISDDPYMSFCKAMNLFYKSARKSSGISGKSITGVNFNAGNNVLIADFVYIADDVTIGDETVIYPFVYIGDNSKIGKRTLIYPNVSIREGVTIGDDVIIHSGAVIGSDGFGFASSKEGKHIKIPQIGGVTIGDRVEIGANVTVDRAALGQTIIKSGTKIDNLVQIAHNCVIGDDCVLVGQAGVSGSTTLGHHVVLAGQVGVAGHLSIGNMVTVGAKSGVTKDIKDGATVVGYPPVPHKEWLKMNADISMLPKMKEKIKDLETRIAELEKKLTGS